jgi:hypothetical protein
VSGISAKAILVGGFIDIMGCMVAGLAFTIIYGGALQAAGVPLSEVQQRIFSDPSYFGVQILLSLPFIMAGGYAAGRLAPGREVLHSCLMGVTGIVVSLAIVRLTPSPPINEPAWFYPLAYGLTVPTAVLGGYFAQRRTQRRQAIGIRGVTQL